MDVDYMRAVVPVSQTHNCGKNVFALEEQVEQLKAEVHPALKEATICRYTMYVSPRYLVKNKTPIFVRRLPPTEPLYH